jgi:hypothetical protein
MNLFISPFLISIRIVVPDFSKTLYLFNKERVKSSPSLK